MRAVQAELGVRVRLGFLLVPLHRVVNHLPLIWKHEML